MKVESGTIGTCIQEQSGGEVAAAGERDTGVVVLETRVGMGTLKRWREQTQSIPARGREWTAGARLEAVVTTAAMNEADKNRLVPRARCISGRAGQVAS